MLYIGCSSCLFSDKWHKDEGWNYCGRVIVSDLHWFWQASSLLRMMFSGITYIGDGWFPSLLGKHKRIKSGKTFSKSIWYFYVRRTKPTDKDVQTFTSDQTESIEKALLGRWS